MTTRRDFLKQASLLGAGLTFSPFFYSSIECCLSK